MGDITIFGIAVPVALIIWYIVVRSLMGYLRYDRDRKRQEYQQKQEWYARMEKDPLLRDFVRIARRANPSYSTYSSDKPTHIRMSKDDAA
jgi:hypothetical protein